VEEILAEALDSDNEYVFNRSRTLPLEGIPFSLTDLGQWKWNWMHTEGSKSALSGVKKDSPASLVAALNSTGAIPIGTTNDGLDVQTTRRIALNPHDPSKAIGSAGAAAGAVASGIGFFAVASDDSGSIRIPSSLCGVVGFKPDHSLKPFSVEPSSFVAHGLITRSIEDCAIVLDAMLKGSYFVTKLQQDLERSIRIAYSSTLGLELKLHPEIQERFLAVLEQLRRAGFHLSEVSSIPIHQYAPFESFRNIWTSSQTDKNKALYNEEDHLNTMNISQTIHGFFNSYDILLTPTTANDSHACSLTFPFNISGNTAISVPVGKTKDNLPIGLQIVQRRIPSASMASCITALKMGEIIQSLGIWDNSPPSFPELKYGPDKKSI
jgi:Asp-tRNA(Asn)/Glu-tRNA(Gln) amidotransferase A subunit family amidase